MARVDQLLYAVEQGLEIFDLGVEMYEGMPQSVNHPSFQMVLKRRHGDLVRPDGSTGATDLIVTGTHVGTHIDALAHAAYLGCLHGGLDAYEAQTGGRFREQGIETVPPIICRGVLLDVPAVLGVDCCAPGQEITVADLDRAVELAGTEPQPGDVILVRSGWGQHYHDRERYVGAATGCPGVGEAGGRWLADRHPRAVGGDTISFECTPRHGTAYALPAHRVLLVDEGINIIELLDLEGLAAAGVREFCFMASPLKLVGATGSPVRPLAVRTQA